MLHALIGPDETEDPVGLISIRGPDFLAIDEPMVAFVLALGLKVGEIRSGTRF